MEISNKRRALIALNLTAFLLWLVFVELYFKMRFPELVIISFTFKVVHSYLHSAQSIASASHGKKAIPADILNFLFAFRYHYLFIMVCVFIMAIFMLENFYKNFYYTTHNIYLITMGLSITGSVAGVALSYHHTMHRINTRKKEGTQ